MANMAKGFPSAEETLNHPAYPSALWTLEPDRKGVLPVAVQRGGPLNISWEIHGRGPTKLVLIMGLVGVMTSWQRQTRYFGHDRGDDYSVLILDNRGIGTSDKPFGRYTTSSMAADVLEILDHVGWTASRDIHLVGISLGGMIAQEIAFAAPNRLASLSLLCTTSKFEGAENKSLTARLLDTASIVVPKSEERSLVDTAKAIFPLEWLEAPDAEDLPSPKSTPRCGPAASRDAAAGGDDEYHLFDSNFQRFQAQELTKRRAPGFVTKAGFLSQLVAAGMHRKSAAQLQAMADAVGRERILVVYGTADGIMHPVNGRKLMDMVKPGVGLVVEGMGHAPVMERAKWFNELLEERLAAWAALGKEEMS